MIAKERLLEKLKVLIAEDTLVYRKILARAVESTGLAAVECTASNGLLAMERLQQHRIDVVLLDVHMPELDGLETLARISREHRELPVIMISGGGSDSAATTMKALSVGALDFIVKPAETDADKSMDRLRSQLQALFTQIHMGKLTSGKRDAAPVRKAQPVNDVHLRTSETQRSPAPVARPPESCAQPPATPPAQPAAQPAGQRKSAAAPEAPGGTQSSKKRAMTGVDLVVIASSTGGPVALEKVLFPLPAAFSKPILVVQHMPADFTRILAHTLGRKCALPVAEAGEGEVIAPGRILIAPGGTHMTVASQGKEKVVKLEKGPLVNGVRPAADVLFASLAKEWAGQRILAIILTGMGSDGMRGVTELKKRCDCYCLAQSEKTCVVYGMPRSVVEAGLADEVVDIADISARLTRIVSGGL
ncbi:chemotaxis-specific protein-glutamate methyltransferase CheB [Heliobacterium undosum]|uniref:Protein-glutamate methylesterase/protein-glutamine glutaminase n=1 Tax=Heliomicrobium undosum TaxID=121734 RepID=A0A845L0I1_9FIRM|nr:chemotaxis-specific protein-glutamate methyltransferase CheB [Heliomicrobium undosum]MZP29957.1 chemotaxis-specific protein-glutamate methyltransferase CheB [Heliomicrobium undosum]